MYQTLKKGGLRCITRLNREAIFEDVETGERSLWLANKNHASYGIRLGNTHYEFVREATYNDLVNMGIE